MINEKIDSENMSFEAMITEFGKPYLKNFNICDNTEKVSKEDLQDMIDNSSFENRIDFFTEVGRTYNFDLAMKRNKSFKYFLSKFNLIN